MDNALNNLQFYRKLPPTLYKLNLHIFVQQLTNFACLNYHNATIAPLPGCVPRQFRLKLLFRTIFNKDTF